MSGATHSRQRRRAMQRHAAEADRAIEGDRRFFARHTDRSYRVRLMSRAERAQMEAFQDGAFDLQEPAQAPFVVLKQIHPGVRLRVTVFGPRESIGDELSDAEAGRIFEAYADRYPTVREREASFRAALFGPGGPLRDGATSASRPDGSPQSTRSRRPGSR